MTRPAVTSREELKQQLSRLSAEQRQRLSARLGNGSSGRERLTRGRAPVLPAEPLRVLTASDGDPGSTVAVYPAGPGQLAMWWNHHVAPDLPVYNSPLAFHLRGRVNVTWLEAALRRVIARHDTLRTTFRMEDTGLVQLVSAAPIFHLQRVDLESAPVADQRRAAARCVEEWARRPFDLAGEPPIRAVLGRLGADEYVLLIVLHHIASDGWSRSNLCRELTVFYQELAGSGSAELPLLPMRYVDYAHWQHRQEKEGVYAGQAAFWRARLAGDLELLELAADRPRPAVLSGAGDQCHLSLAPALWAGLNARAQEERVTLFMVLLSAFKALLHRQTGQEDIRVAVPVANRHRQETEGLIALIINTLLVRLPVSANLTFRELIQRVKTAAVDAYAHADLPFERVVEVCRGQSTSRLPLVQALFALQDFPPAQLNLPGVEAIPWPVTTGTAKADHNLAVERAGDGWISNLEFSTDLFERRQADQLLIAWRSILECCVERPDQQISDLPLALPRRDGCISLGQDRLRGGLTCHLIGTSPLVRECGEILIKSGCSVLGVVALDDSARAWARERRIPLAPSGCDLVEWLQSRPFDYLFSIVNPRILPEAVLRLPARGAINYHNALLPRYAGLHAASWAILMGERVHGITWHRMVETVDGGDILKQRSLELGTDETPLTLLRRCDDLAADAFTELVAELLDDTAVPVAQDASKRTYFSGQDRPPAAATIFWTRTALEIMRLVRGLDFGPFRNPLAFPKLAAGGEFLLVRGAKSVQGLSAAPPGTVLALSPEGLTVATATEAVEINGLMTVDGEPVSVLECERRFHWLPGQRLPELPQDQSELITRAHAGVTPHESFWVRRLQSWRGVPLPFGREIRASPPSGRQRHITWTVPGEVADWIERRKGCWTQEEFVLAAFGAYLARLCGLESFEVGWTVSKDGTEAALLPALFATHVPFQFAIDCEGGLDVLLPAVRAELELVRERGTYIREIVPRHPVLQRNPELRQGFHPSVVVQSSDLSAPARLSGQTELLWVLPRHGCEGRAVFSEDAFDEEGMERLIGHFQVFLASLAAGDGRMIARADLLDEGERTALRQLGLGPPVTNCSGPWLHAQIEAQAARAPSALAVMCGDESLTYQQLNQRANQLAGALRARGVGPDRFAAIFLERSVEMIVAVLGVLKAGGAYLPLEPAYPRERLAFILEDAQPRVVVTTRNLASALPAQATLLLCLDELPVPEPEAFLDNPASGVMGSHLAYAIYTSGSTGRPNGVLIEHQSVANYIGGMPRQFGLIPGDRLLQFASLSFDASVEEIFVALTCGAALVLRTEEMLAQAAVFLSRCAEWQLTVLSLPTAYWTHLAAEIESQDLRLPPCVRLVVIGGERAAPETLASWQRSVGSAVTLWNTYGPTETTIATTGCDLTHEPAVSGRELPIGRPVPSAAVYVVDRWLQLLPQGVLGELCVAGPGLARAYLNRPELTASRFIANPFEDRPGGRVYRTGDRVRYRQDGWLEFHGRLDDQVKVRGHRIELGEVESVLKGHPALRDAAVVAGPDENGETRLNALVVGRTPEPMGPSTLREWLAARLPEFMVPTRFAILPALPLTSSGKVDRKALATVQATELRTGHRYEGPRDELERRLAEIWQGALRREQVGIHDSFFDLGGHSLLAVVINARITRQCGVELPLRWILEHPTVEQLARRIRSLLETREKAGAIERVDRQQPIPMSYPQQQMWLLHQILPDPAAYNVPLACRMCGPVDRDRVRQAVGAVFARHEALRTSLLQENGRLLQRIHAAPELALPWREESLQGVPEAERWAAVARCLADEAGRPFDLGRAPPWRATWLQLDADDQVLTFVFHHGVMDDWSLRLFFDEWTTLYARQGDAPDAGLPELPVQYADFAAWHRQKLSGQLLEQQRRYWKTQLAELPPALDLPRDQPRPAQPSGRGAGQEFQLSGPVVKKLRGLAREEGTTLFTVLLAAFQVWLHRYSRQDDLIVGTPVVRRERPEVHSLIGYFLNTLPVRSRYRSEASFREMLHATRETLLGAFSHADLPFETMVEMTVKERASNNNPLYQAMFVLLDEPAPVWRLGGVELQRVPVETRTSKNDLTLSIRAEADHWDCRLEYASDLFSAHAAARMIAHLTELFRSIAAQPDEAIGRLNWMTEAERRAVLVEWNLAETREVRGVSIAQLFEEQVERTPEAVAIRCHGETLSYHALNRAANQLAHHLRGLGIGPGDAVGLCLERSFQMMVGLLGILKAGGACLPLDPHLPPRRLGFLMSNAACKIVITRPALRPLLNEVSGPPPVCLPWDAGAPAWSEAGVSNPVPVSAPEDPLYILYTSGSTGEPKGVEMPHRALVNLVNWQTSSSGMGAGSRTLQFASLGFDVSFQEILATWLTGGILVLIPDEARIDPVRLWSHIRDEGVERVFLPFVMLERLAETARLPAPRLQEVIVAGEQLRIGPALRRFFEGLPACRLWNHYGPTETHVVTAYPLSGPLSAWPDLPPIGRPLPNCQVYVLDPLRNPVPPGVFGELWVGGVCLALGYRHRPDLTRERFIPSPFGQDFRTRLYRTGDVGRWRADGQLEYAGRIDDQVKIRGYRIELGEVEMALRGLDGVGEAAVVVRDRGEKHLVAYVAPAGHAVLDPAKIQAGLRARLPGFMLPRHTEILTALPLTANGKVDRRALPEPDLQRTPGRKSVPPRGLLEWQLLRIWQELFGREDIQVEDNFFELGGHSLLAARLAGRVEERLGCQLPIAALFQSPTIAALARRLTEENWASAWSSLVPLQPLGSRPPLFFVHGWGGDVYGFLDMAQRLAPDQPAYGLQAVGLDGRAERHTTVEQMAAHYVREVRSFQPEGPYYLTGFSMGGLIALEMAQQLYQQHARVAFLGLLDTSPKSVPWTVYGRTLVPYLFQRSRYHLRHWARLPHRDRFSYLQRCWTILRQRISRNRAAPAVVRAVPKKEIQPPRIPGFEDYYWAVASAYRLRRYPGTIDMFVSDSADPALVQVWRHLARGGALLHRIPGQHLEIIQPAYLPAVTDALRAALARVQHGGGEAAGR